MPEPVWVLDTSVAAAWFFTDDEQHDSANRVLENVSRRPDDFGVPDLIYAELVHVLSRRSGNDASFVEDGVGAVLDLGIRSLALTREAIRGAARLSCEGMSGYDATFAAVAADYGATWLTADERAAAHAPSARTLRAWPAET